jgi:RNA polymerase sigma-70 factor (ECF subfamily)
VTPGNDEIAALLSRVALKDRQAFSDLYSRIAPKLFGVCLRLLRSRSEAEDALQDVFVKIWQRADRFRADDGSAAGWLAAIARHHSIDVIRARKPVASDMDAVWDIADPLPDPEAQEIGRSEGRRIDSCMEQLETDKAAAVKSAYVEGLSYQELAELYAVPLNTMRTWLRRSLLKLRECLER